MFAKPFVDALGGHQDGVYCLGKDSRRAGVVAGGGGDGEVIVHSLGLRRPLLKIPGAHRGMVGGICWTSEAQDRRRGLITCGKLDGTIKLWRSEAFAPGLRDKDAFEGNEFGLGQAEGSGFLDQAGAIGESGYDEEEGGGLSLDSAKRDALGQNLEPTMTFASKNGLNGIDHHRTDAVFATASNTVQIWDEHRTAPLNTLQFGNSMETVSGVKFNQSETSVLASVGNDRTMCLYDIRTGKAERRIVTQVGTIFLKKNSLRKNSCLAVHSSPPTASRGVPPSPPFFFSAQRITTSTHLTFATLKPLIKFTRATSVVSWDATGARLAKDLSLGHMTELCGCGTERKASQGMSTTPSVCRGKFKFNVVCSFHGHILTITAEYSTSATPPLPTLSFLHRMMVTCAYGNRMRPRNSAQFRPRSVKLLSTDKNLWRDTAERRASGKSRRGDMCRKASTMPRS